MLIDIKLKNRSLQLDVEEFLKCNSHASGFLNNPKICIHNQIVIGQFCYLMSATNFQENELLLANYHYVIDIKDMTYKKMDGGKFYPDKLIQII